MNYLRPDITVTLAESKPINDEETMNHFIDRMQKSGSEHIYIEILDSIDNESYDKSIIDFMNNNKEVQFIKLK